MITYVGDLHPIENTQNNKINKGDVVRVRDTKPKQLITITNWVGDVEFYLITIEQDVKGLVRAYKELEGGIVYLDPRQPCELVTKKILSGVV